MGLPDVTDIQQEIAEEMRKQLLAGLDTMLAGLDTMDPQAMLRSWGPTGAEGWEQFQNMFWSGLAAAGQDKKD